jgi:hypothetical protein
MRRALIGTLAPAARCVALWCTLLLPSPALDVSPQDSLRVGPGDRVRLAAPGLVEGRSVGTVMAHRPIRFCWSTTKMGGS